MQWITFTFHLHLDFWSAAFQKAQCNNTCNTQGASQTKCNSSPGHHIPEPCSAPLPQLPPNLWSSSAVWKIWPLQSDRHRRGLWRPADQQALSEHLSGASSQSQGPSSRTLATAPWHLILQAFILLEVANLWKTYTTNIMILACFALKANYWSTVSSLCKIFRPNKNKSEFLFKIAFLRVLLMKKTSFLWLHHRKDWI